MKKAIKLILIYVSLSFSFNLYSQLPHDIDLGPLKIDKIDIGNVKIGTNTVKITVTNHSDSIRNFYLDIRVLGILSWQRNSSYTINPGETSVCKKEYIIADASSIKIRFKFGVPKETWIGKNDPRVTMFDHEIDWTIKKQYFHKLNFPNEELKFWNSVSSSEIRQKIPKLREQLNTTNSSYRDSLLSLVRYQRKGFDNFSVKKIRARSEDKIIIESWELEGEPNEPIGFLFMQLEDLPKPYKTVLFLTGNPPGRKEPYVNRLMLLAKAGYRVAIMDRRLSARKTLVGEFWNNTANPVFDAMHLIDYIVGLEETDKEAGIAIMGFSKGAAESQMVAALHEEVSCAILLCRMIDYEVLFESAMWWPTLYIPQFIVDIGADSILNKPWEEQLNFMTTDVLKTVKQKFYENYSFYDSKRILKLIAPKPLLLVTGALDEQFPLKGVISLDMEIEKYYNKIGVLSAYNFYIMPRAGHGYDAHTLNLIIDYLSVWFD